MKLLVNVIALLFLLNMSEKIIKSDFIKVEIDDKETSEIEIKPTPTPRLITDLKIKVNLPYWDQKRAFKTVKSRPEIFNELSFFWYYLNSQGNIITYKYAKEDESIIQFAKEHGISAMAVVTNLPENQGVSWDSERVEKLLSEASLRDNHVRAIVNKVEEMGFDGASIDYEEVDPEQREKFSGFIKELADALHSKDKILGLSLHPKFGENIDSRYAFQNWRELCKYADRLYIMAYGEHWDEGEPGPIASINWVLKIIHYTKSLDVPMSKFYLGIPLYGYDWHVESGDTAKGLTHSEVLQLIKEYQAEVLWDEISKSPHFSYRENGHIHEVWFENKQSVFEKINLALEHDFAGVAFWRLGGEDDSIWERLNNFDSE